MNLYIFKRGGDSDLGGEVCADGTCRIAFETSTGLAMLTREEEYVIRESSLILLPAVSPSARVDATDPRLFTVRVSS